MGTASAIIKKARHELGVKEQPTNRTKYGEWYGMNGQPWCDMFVSWCAAYSDNKAVVGKFAYCPSHVAWFKRKKRWGSKPRVGAIVFFSWGGGVAAHVGIVEKVNKDGSIITIEGNTSNGVYRKRRKAGIIGYGYPAYSGSGPHRSLAAADEVDESEFKDDAAPQEVDTKSRPEDGDQSDVPQDPNMDLAPDDADERSLEPVPSLESDENDASEPDPSQELSAPDASEPASSRALSVPNASGPVVGSAPDASEPDAASSGKPSLPGKQKGGEGGGQSAYSITIDIHIH